MKPSVGIGHLSLAMPVLIPSRLSLTDAAGRKKVTITNAKCKANHPRWRRRLIIIRQRLPHQQRFSNERKQPRHRPCCETAGTADSNPVRIETKRSRFSLTSGKRQPAAAHLPLLPCDQPFERITSRCNCAFAHIRKGI